MDTIILKITWPENIDHVKKLIIYQKCRSKSEARHYIEICSIIMIRQVFRGLHWGCVNNMKMISRNRSIPLASSTQIFVQSPELWIYTTPSTHIDYRMVWIAILLYEKMVPNSMRHKVLMLVLLLSRFLFLSLF